MRTFKQTAKTFLQGVPKDQRKDKLIEKLLPAKGLGSVTADQVRLVQEKFNLGSREEAEKVLGLKNELDLIEKVIIKKKLKDMKSSPFLQRNQSSN